MVSGQSIPGLMKTRFVPSCLYQIKVFCIGHLNEAIWITELKVGWQIKDTLVFQIRTMKQEMFLRCERFGFLILLETQHIVLFYNPIIIPRRVCVCVCLRVCVCMCNGDVNVELWVLDPCQTQIWGRGHLRERNERKRGNGVRERERDRKGGEEGELKGFWSNILTSRSV